MMVTREMVLMSGELLWIALAEVKSQLNTACEIKKRDLCLTMECKLSVKEVQSENFDKVSKINI